MQSKTMRSIIAVAAVLMPVCFFIGRRDRVVVPKTSVAYHDDLKAPSKTFFGFEESGHEPPAEEPGKFNSLMVEMVRPVTVSASIS